MSNLNSKNVGSKTDEHNVTKYFQKLLNTDVTSGLKWELMNFRELEKAAFNKPGPFLTQMLGRKDALICRLIASLPNISRFGYTILYF